MRPIRGQISQQIAAAWSTSGSALWFDPMKLSWNNRQRYQLCLYLPSVNSPCCQALFFHCLPHSLLAPFSPTFFSLRHFSTSISHIFKFYHVPPVSRGGFLHTFSFSGSIKGSRYHPIYVKPDNSSDVKMNLHQYFKCSFKISLEVVKTSRSDLLPHQCDKML